MSDKAGLLKKISTRKETQCYSAAVGKIELWERLSEPTVVISEDEEHWLDLPVTDIPELITHLQAIHELHRGSW